MSEESTTPDRTELVRRFHEAASRRDFDAWLALLSQDVVYRPIPTFTEVRECRGHEEFRRFQDGFMEAWADFSFSADTIRDYGDALIVRTSLTGHAKASGIAVSERVFCVYRFRDGQISRVEDFVDRADALRASGASE